MNTLGCQNRNCQANMTMSHLESSCPYTPRPRSTLRTRCTVETCEAVGRKLQNTHKLKQERGKRAVSVLSHMASHLCRGPDICSAKRLSGANRRESVRPSRHSEPTALRVPRNCSDGWGGRWQQQGGDALPPSCLCLHMPGAISEPRVPLALGKGMRAGGHHVQQATLIQK